MRKMISSPMPKSTNQGVDNDQNNKLTKRQNSNQLKCFNNTFDFKYSVGNAFQGKILNSSSWKIMKEYLKEIFKVSKK